MLFFVALFPFFVLQGADTPASSRRWGCLLPPTCLALGTVAFSEFEDSGEVGVTTVLFAVGSDRVYDDGGVVGGGGGDGSGVTAIGSGCRGADDVRVGGALSHRLFRWRWAQKRFCF